MRIVCSSCNNLLRGAGVGEEGHTGPSKDQIIQELREEVAMLQHKNVRTVRGLREREAFIASCERKMSADRGRFESLILLYILNIPKCKVSL